MPFTGILLSLLFASPTFASAPGPVCPANWESARVGNCWIRTKLIAGNDGWAFVHRRGWVVDGRCFSDSRFSKETLLVSLETAWRRMDPDLSVEAGGCLSEFNPTWGRELQDAIWTKRMYLSCPKYDPETKRCAYRSRRDAYLTDAQGRRRRHENYFNLLVFDNVQRCMHEQGSGLAGVAFHESLHAAEADNYKVAKHNKAWELPQYEFVGDRIYAAEAVCFFATDPRKRPLVNFLQCKRVIEYEVSEPDRKLCRGFDASFTDRRPPGFIKH